MALTGISDKQMPSLGKDGPVVIAAHNSRSGLSVTIGRLMANRSRFCEW
jgi:hypothetical protein